VSIPRYEVDDPVRVRDDGFAGHTRCPRYVRGRRGTIVAVEAAAPLPELEAHANEKVDEAIYAVRFESTELWGDAADEHSCVHVDLYEHHLEPAGDV
jgi:nitrile hydratase